MINHSDSTNGGPSVKDRQRKLKADRRDPCPNCELIRTALKEMKEGYEKALELSGLNMLELQQELQEFQLENHKLRSELKECTNALAKESTGRREMKNN